MALIGYARVSTEEQVLFAQTDALKAAGCTRIIEERASGGDRLRPLLAKAMELVGAGDTLVVARVDRLARSLSHLLTIIDRLRQRGAHFRSLGDPIDTSSPQGLFTLHVIGAMAEFERALIRERTLAGLAAARARGRIGGNPKFRARDPEAMAQARETRSDQIFRAIEAGAGLWLPAVVSMRPHQTWSAVAAAVNASLPEGRAKWTEARLRRAARAMVAAGRLDHAVLDVAGKAGEKRAQSPALRVVAALVRGNPALSLRQIAGQLEEMGERTPRGGTRWGTSSVANLRAKAKRAGMLRRLAGPSVGVPALLRFAMEVNGRG